MTGFRIIEIECADFEMCDDKKSCVLVKNILKNTVSTDEVRCKSDIVEKIKWKE